VVNKILRILSKKTVIWENHKTVNAFEASFVTKYFLLSVCNFLVPLAILGFYFPNFEKGNCYFDKTNCTVDLRIYYASIFSS